MNWFSNTIYAKNGINTVWLVGLQNLNSIQTKVTAALDYIFVDLSSSYLDYLTSLCLSVAFSNIIGSGVPTQSSDQRAVSLHHYVILIYYIRHYPRSISSASASAYPPSPN